MKKIILSVITIVALLSITGTALAVKPTGNLAGAEKVDWNLSADVMPVPPYGSRDIVGSDTASKLIVNQPNGNTEVAITGAMNGLNPNTTYTVYIANGYTVQPVWDVSGDWTIAVNNGVYVHDYTFTMAWNDNHFTGVGNYPAGGTTVFDEVVIDGLITGNTITFTAVYYNPITHIATGYSWTGTGTIDADDGLVSGTGTNGVTEWHSTSGQATKVLKGSGWTGLFNKMLPFTFTTDEFGAGSWHVNLRDGDFPGSEKYNLSVWINEAGGTMLISDNFDVVVD